jgi:hypothetical protein
MSNSEIQKAPDGQSHFQDTLERSARCYRAMTCSPVMGRKVGDILQILGGGLIP